MKRIIVTGGTGFVGAGLTRRLLAAGHQVHLIVRSGHAAWRLSGIQDDVRLVELNMTDAEATARAVAAIRPDWIFHLAAHGAYSYQKDLRQMVQTNIVATINLVEAALQTGIEAFINTGSSSEYGFKDHPPAEEEWLDPNSHYAVTKASATMYCRHTALSRQAPIRTLRLYSIYGPFEEPTRLFPALLIRGLRGEFPPLVNPAIARDFVYLEDACDAFIQAAAVAGQAPGAVYNVGSGVQTSLGELVEIVRRALRIEAEPQWGSMPDRHWDTAVWVADPARIRRELGWAPRYDLERGILEMAAWLCENPEYHKYYSDCILGA